MFFSSTISTYKDKLTDEKLFESQKILQKINNLAEKINKTKFDVKVNMKN